MIEGYSGSVMRVVQISEQVMTRTYYVEPSPMPRHHVSAPASRPAPTPATSAHSRRPALQVMEEPQLKKARL